MIEISLENDTENTSVIRHVLGMSMNQMRHLRIEKIIEAHHIQSIIDLGCSEGLFLQKLGRSEKMNLIVGVDCDETAVTSAALYTYP